LASKTRVGDFSWVPSPRLRGEGQGEGLAVRFGEVPLGEAAGAILAHSLKLDSAVLKKGRLLSPADVDLIAAAGLDHVVAARLDPGDLREDEAADRVAAAHAGHNLPTAAAITRRANQFAQAPRL
jgi:molybdenum cofactor cytidylyltransferase